MIDVVLSGANERRLLNDLMAQYNTLERPVYNESEPLIVSFGLTLQQIIDIVSHSFLSILHPSPIWKFSSSSHHLSILSFSSPSSYTCSLFPSISSTNVFMHPSFFRTVFPACILPFILSITSAKVYSKHDMYKFILFPMIYSHPQ